MKASKEYSTKSSAKRSMWRVMSGGLFANQGTTARRGFVDARIENKTLILSSNYYSQHSLEKMIAGTFKSY